MCFALNARAIRNPKFNPIELGVKLVSQLQNQSIDSIITIKGQAGGHIGNEKNSMYVIWIKDGNTFGTFFTVKNKYETKWFPFFDVTFLIKASSLVKKEIMERGIYTYDPFNYDVDVKLGTLQYKYTLWGTTKAKNPFAIQTIIIDHIISIFFFENEQWKSLK